MLQNNNDAAKVELQKIEDQISQNLSLQNT